MAKTNILQFFKGLAASRTGQTPASGEPLWVTDDKELYIGDGATAGGIKIGPYVAGDFAHDSLSSIPINDHLDWTQAVGTIHANNYTDTIYSLPQATATVRGGVEIFSNTVQVTAVSAAPSTTADRTYGIQLNSSDQMVVNIPWVNTTYDNTDFVDLTTIQTVAGKKTWSSNAYFAADVGIGVALPAGHILNVLAGAEADSMFVSRTTLQGIKMWGEVAGNFIVSESSSAKKLVIAEDSGTGSISFENPRGSDRMRISSTGTVGINETIPLGKLHVRSNDSAVAAAHVNADELVLENSANAGMSILSVTTGSIYFSDVASTTVGGIVYNHTGDYMDLRAGGAQRMRIGSTWASIGGTSTVYALSVVNSGNTACFGAIPGTNPSTAADELTLYRNSSSGLSIIGGDTSTTNIYFGKVSANSRGRIVYSNNASTMAFYSNSLLRMTFDAATAVFGTGASAATYHLGLKTPTGDGFITFGSDDTYTTGSSIKIYSGSHSANAYDMHFWANTDIELKYTHTDGEWDFMTNPITWSYTTHDSPFFNFVATADADTTSAISTLNTSGATTDHIQIEINGTKAWIAVSTNNPS